METLTPEKRDYRATLNLTLNDKDPRAFPQRAALPMREPEFQRRWEEMDLYRKSLDKPAPNGTFILHDGPPYSNGDIHLGHALNKIAKDVITRFRTMEGYKSPYVPGWDNHGMPIENAVARAFRERKETPDRVTLRRACREYAANFVEKQRTQFKRLGIRGDWENPYLTMSAEFEARIVEVFGELAQDGFIYRGLKPVLWCATCETALADAEVEYENHVSNSIYVRFPLWNDPDNVFDLPDAEPATRGEKGGGVPSYAIIWTTTPWTIPANLALAVHPDAEYAIVRATHADKRRADDAEDPAEDETAYYVLARPLVDPTMVAITAQSFEVVKSVNGADLLNLVFRHPLFERTAPVLPADYVTMDAGTGVVHTAPGHGKEDFETGQKHGLEVLNPVGPDGRYTAAAGEFNGRSFEGLRVTTFGDAKGKQSEADMALIEALRSSGNLLSVSMFEHSYPHCWRCHSPVIFRATVQWFMNIDHDGFRRSALAAIQDVDWYPKESVNRITSMVASRPDWCVSRQRSWGVGIPAFYCDNCGEHVITPESVAAVAAITRAEGSDAWYVRSAAEILPAGFVCPNCGVGVDRLRKETDVLDVWFDSGSTSRAVLEDNVTWPDLTWPADLYLEGGDQHRGWFNSSLMIGVATKGKAPYRGVVTNGWTLDENGRAMHKSLGNVVNPHIVIEKFGADVLRCWVASQNFMEDTRCGDHVLQQVGDSYRRIRNTFRFLLNNLYDFDPATDLVPDDRLLELDRWILSELYLVVQTARSEYDAYRFHQVYVTALGFCTTELSSIYLDVLKDRLYASAATSHERRSAQTALYRIAHTLSRLLAPILVHTSEEVWDHLRRSDAGHAESVHLADLPSAPELAAFDLRPAFIDLYNETADAVNRALEAARKDGTLPNSLEAKLVLGVPGERADEFRPNLDRLQDLYRVSDLRMESSSAITDFTAAIHRADGGKCPRCWLIKRDIGTDPAEPELCGRCAAAVVT